MGWLDCNPDELFLPTRFTVRDLPYYTPGPVENFLIGLSHITPDFVMHALDGPLSTSFTARPMQVPFVPHSFPFSASPAGVRACHFWAGRRLWACGSKQRPSLDASSCRSSVCRYPCVESTLIPNLPSISLNDLLQSKIPEVGTALTSPPHCLPSLRQGLLQ